jgi:hypothetical protein
VSGITTLPIPEGLPELLRAITDSQATLAGAISHEGTERGKIMLRTMELLAKLIETFSRVVVEGPF